MNAIEMNDFEMNDYEVKPIVYNVELLRGQIDAVLYIWSKYSEHISDDIFCEEGGYCYVTYYVLLMKMSECGTELRELEERRHFISLLKTLMETIYNLKEGTIQDFAFITNLYCDIHRSYGMKVSLNNLV